MSMHGTRVLNFLNFNQGKYKKVNKKYIYILTMDLGFINEKFDFHSLFML